MTHHQSQRRRRRHSAVCNRHPTSKPTTGFCAACLRERLSTIEALSSDQAPELRRARSHSVRDASASDFDQARGRSCDVNASLHNRFAEDDDERLGRSIRIRMVPDSKEEEEDGEEKKTMKELIDLESRTTDKSNNDKESSSSFTSVFSRTLKRLSLKHPNPQNGDVYSKKTGLGGRRSCDVDPRLSLDAVSFQEPRASWDGCFVGKTYHPNLIPLSSVTEDAKASPEKEEEEKRPGGTAQTRDYYLDSRRRRSFDRSSSRLGGLVDLVVDQVKPKLSPQTSVGLFHGAKLLVTESQLRDSNWYSIQNYKPQSFEFASKGVSPEVKQDGFGFGLKKSGKRWGKGWNLWGLIQRKADTTTKNEDQSLKLGGNAMEGSLADSLLKLRRVAKGGESNGGDVSEKLLRSYSVSARKSCDDGIFHGASLVNNGFQGGRSSCDGLFHGSITGGGAAAETGRRSLCEDKQNHLLQRDAKLGASYSPDNLRNGMVKFYLTPLKSHVTSKSRLMNESEM